MDELELKPCPFCGGKELVTNEWELDSGYTVAIECCDCHAGAPVAAWEKLKERSVEEQTV